MDQVIAKLLEVDKAAVKLAEDARGELQRTKDAIEGERLNFKSGYIEKATQRINLLEQEEQTHLEEACRELETERKRQLKQLQTSFDAKREEWEQAIFERCIAD